MLDPWPWYVSGPIIGLVVPLLALMGRQFGISANFRHLCAACGGSLHPFFRYDWRRDGMWNLVFALGLVLGGFVAARWLTADPISVAIAPATRADLAALGIMDLTGFAPPQLVSWGALGTVGGVCTLIVGGFLVGFGSRWAGGCTSGHAIAGLSGLQVPSLVAVCAFFAGGLFMTHVLLPVLLR